MMDRTLLYVRWHSLALAIGTRACGKTQKLEASVSGSHSPPAPNAGDMHERQELTGRMGAWLEQFESPAESVEARMNDAIVMATDQQLQHLLTAIERAEWLLKLKWSSTDECHRRLLTSEADAHGLEEWERHLLTDFQGVHTKDVAQALFSTVDAVRWRRRKHGLDTYGNRIYPCTVAPQNACPVCRGLGAMSEMEAA